jgi:hypothetical protein
MPTRTVFVWPQISLDVSRKISDWGKVTCCMDKFPGDFRGPMCAVGHGLRQAKIDGDGNMSKWFFATAILAGTLSTVALAGPVTDEETKYCAYDYRQYCNQDGLGSQLLALCMRDHGKELSPQCIKALEDAGEVTPEEKAELKKIGE